MPTYGYIPTPTPLTQDELDLLAAEQQAMGGYVPSGGYVAEPVPPPSAGLQAVPPPAAVLSPGLGSGSAYTAPPPEAVPPPPPSGQWDFLAPLGQARDAAVASPVGQAVGGVMSTPLPFADRVDVPPPTAVGARLAAGDPLGAGQLVADVATADPVTTASLLLGGPVLGTVARGALGLGRAAGVVRAAAPIARPAAQTIDQYRRIKKLEQMSPLRRLAEEHGGMIGLGVPAAAVGAILKDFDPSAPTTGTNTPSETESAARYRTGGSPPATPATSTRTPATTRPAGTSAAGRPASRVPASAPVSATTQTTPTAPVSAPTRSSTSPQTGGTDTDDDLLATLGLLDDPIDIASAEPFTASDFTGRLGNLPGLGSVTPTMASRMARIANGRLRRRRGKRNGAFTMERGEFHRLISESVYAALRGER